MNRCSILLLTPCLLIAACGDSAPTPAQQGSTYAQAFKTQADKVLKIRDLVATDCAAGKADPCLKDIVDMASAAKSAKAALPAAPTCMKDADIKARAGFSQIEQGGASSVDALAAENDAQVKATSEAVKAGADQLVAAAAAIGGAKC